VATDINPNKFGQTLNVIQRANQFGTLEDVYDGVDPPRTSGWRGAPTSQVA
jgi:hypothetical protein